MPIQFSVAVGNARLDAVETATGVSPTLEIRSGSPPVDCAAADTGTLLASLALPSNWMADASARSKALSGTWQDLSADATGTAGHFRIKQGATCHIQGTCAASGADMNISPSAAVTLGQSFTVSTFTLTDGNA